MKLKMIVLLGSASIPILCGCMGSPTQLSTVGPDPAGRAWAGAKGGLQVFSATETRANELVTVDYHGYFHPHSGYDVKDESGKTVRFVPNHASIMDEWPEQVALPAGHYNVVAESARCGLVTVPVLIEPGKTTVVHLDGNWWPSSKTTAKQLVCLPNGESVGWSSSAANSSN